MALQHPAIARRGDVYWVKPTEISVETGWNPRTEFDTPEDFELVESIRTEGVKIPILLKKIDDRLVIVDGERRWRAVMRLYQSGVTDILIKAEIVAANKIDPREALKQAILRNTGKELNIVEEANAYARLVKYGMVEADIAAMRGKSTNYIRDRLAVSRAAPAVQQALLQKEIYIAQAKEIVDASEGSFDRQGELLAEAKAEKERAMEERKEKIAATWENKRLGEQTGGDDAPDGVLVPQKETHEPAAEDLPSFAHEHSDSQGTSGSDSAEASTASRSNESLAAEIDTSLASGPELDDRIEQTTFSGLTEQTEHIEQTGQLGPTGQIDEFEQAGQTKSNDVPNRKANPQPKGLAMTRVEVQAALDEAIEEFQKGTNFDDIYKGFLKGRIQTFGQILGQEVPDEFVM